MRAGLGYEESGEGLRLVLRCENGEELKDVRVILDCVVIKVLM